MRQKYHKDTGLRHSCLPYGRNGYKNDHLRSCMLLGGKHCSAAIEQNCPPTTPTFGIRYINVAIYSKGTDTRNTNVLLHQVLDLPPSLGTQLAPACRFKHATIFGQFQSTRHPATAQRAPIDHSGDACRATRSTVL